MTVLTSKGPVLITKTFDTFQAVVTTPVLEFDVMKTVGNSATTVVYTYPMITNERLAVVEFVGVVTGYGNPGASAMYRVMGRFARSFSGVNSQVDVQQELVSETDAGLDMTVQLSGTDVQIVCTSPALNGDGAHVRVVGRVIETKLPVPL